MSPHGRKRMGPAAIGVTCVFGACWAVGCSTVLGIGDWTNLVDGGDADSTGDQGETADGSHLSQDAATSDGSAHPEASKDSSEDGSASIDSSEDAPDTTGDADAAACSTMCGGNCVNEQTDNTNCGACARNCVGQPCTGGVCTPVVLASGTNVTGSENYLAVDAVNSTVSWTNYLSGGSVVRMPTTVGATQTVLATNQSFPGDTYSIFAVSGQTFWGTLSAGLWGGPAATGGGYPEWGSSANAPQATGGVCINGTTAYWIAINGDAFTLYKQNLAVAPSTVPAAVASSTSVSAYYLACDATGLYWAESSSGFWRQPYGGTAVEVATAQPSGIGADGLGNVYFTGQSLPLQAMTSAGTNVHTISVTGGLTGPSVVIANSTYVYVDDIGTIKRIPVGGGTPLVIATGSVGFGSMGMDGTYIYFFSSSGLVRTPQ